MKRFFAIFLVLAALLTGCSSQSTPSLGSSESISTSDALYGKVTAIDGNKITLALGTQSAGTPPSKPDESGSGDTLQQDNAPAGDTSGNAPGKPDGSAPSGEAPGGTPPTELTLTGEEKIITISDESIITAQNGESSTSAKLSAIVVGSLLKFTMDGDKLTSVEIMQSMEGDMGGGGNSSGTEGASVEGTAALLQSGGTDSKDNQAITASDENQSAVKVTGGGTLTLNSAKITTSGASSSEEESNFYGLNAGVLATSKSTISLKDCTITTSGEGANAVFATGDGTTVNVDHIIINTTADSSRGLDATYNGTINAANVTITTKGAHCAALATDRGEGTVTVDGGTGSTAGEGSPGIYSTGKITASNMTLTATGSEAAVVEGKNSITLTNTSLSGASRCGVMMYQSYSGDASVGTSSFTMTGGTLTAKTGPLFFITNTDAVITLKGATLIGSGNLITAAADQWGTEGSNGGVCTLTGDGQTLSGNIVCDSISSASLILTNSSSYTGTVNADKTAKSAALSLDATSVWNVTGTSYLTSLTNADATLSNIKDNGNTIYYDSVNSANSWLNGKTIALSGGGTLTPAK